MQARRSCRPSTSRTGADGDAERYTVRSKRPVVPTHGAERSGTCRIRVVRRHASDIRPSGGREYGALKSRYR